VQPLTPPLEDAPEIPPSEPPAPLLEAPLDEVEEPPLDALLEPPLAEPEKPPLAELEKPPLDPPDELAGTKPLEL
jgi:hypothetical protein